MFILFLFSGVCSFLQVKTYPLLQTSQPYPVTNYQQSVYRPSYSEAYIVQPNHISPYTQQIPIQTPTSTYHTFQVPSLTEQISKFYLDKLLSNPSLRSILDPNNIVQNQHGKDTQTNLPPYNTGGVVNNYIIVPAEYLKVNETVSKKPKEKRARKELKDPIQENVTTKERKKKVLSNKQVTIQNKNSSDTKKSKKARQNIENSWSFSTDNIKCFTPADILESEKYAPDGKNKKNNDITKHHNSKKTKSSRSSRNKEGSQRSRNIKRNNVKKKSNENGERKEKADDNLSSLTNTHKKNKKCKKPLEECDCGIQDQLPDCKSNVEEETITHCCDEDINDLLLSKILQQGCTDVENRQTRNSKTDADMRESRSMYPDLSGDISKSLSWYLNDFYSPQSIQQVPTSNVLLGNNMYPFDITQIYQIPQYSNTDSNKSNSNAGQDQNTRQRKKKKKKNSRTKTNKENVENVSNSEDSKKLHVVETNVQISEPNIQSSKTSAQILETNFEIPESSFKISQTNFQIPPTDFQVPQINIQIPKKRNRTQETNTKTSNITILVPEISGYILGKSSRTKPEAAVEIASSISEIKSAKKDPNPTEKSVNENLGTNVNTSSNRILESLNVSLEQNNFNQNKLRTKSQEEKSELQPNPGFIASDQFLEEVSDAEILNILLDDYYPDFREDNHAYLVSEEEIDMRNINDRYFYATDRNIESREMYSPQQTNPIFSNRGIGTEHDLQNNNMVNYNSFMNQVRKKDESEELVFKTPPALEFPDFITRKINSDRLNSAEINYNYEDDFDSSPENSDNINETTKRVNENEEGLVETVYARSKVVKYGQCQELPKLSSPVAASTTVKQEDVSLENDGPKTVVIAKSLKTEDYW